MGERKVLNKWIDPDFDASLVPKLKNTKVGAKAALQKKNGGSLLTQIRMMIPFSMQCSTCNGFLYRGKKFNCFKEEVQGSKAKYLGIQRLRFHIKCTVCSRAITFLTDPEKGDYEMESGAVRNYEVWGDEEATNEEVDSENAKAEKLDPMKALENRVEASRREMEVMDELEELKDMNRRHVAILGNGQGGSADVSSILWKEEEQEVNEDGITEEDEKFIKSIKFGGGGGVGGGEKCIRGGDDNIKRLDSDDESDEGERLSSGRDGSSMSFLSQQGLQMEKEGAIEKKAEVKPVFNLKVKRKKRKVEDNASNSTRSSSSCSSSAPPIKKANLSAQPIKKPVTTSSVNSLLAAYGSDSDSD